MTGSPRLRPVYLVGLIVGLLAVALQGVQGEDELDSVPSEVQCRPYIEKALKDLGTGPLEQSSTEDGPDSQEDAGPDEQQDTSTQDSEEVADDATADSETQSGEESAETGSVVDDDDGVSAEEPKNDSNETKEDGEESAQEDDKDTTSDSREGNDEEKKQDSTEDESAEAADKAIEDKDEADSGEADEKSAEKDEESVEKDSVETSEVQAEDDNDEDERQDGDSDEKQEDAEEDAEKSEEDKDATAEDDSKVAEDSVESGEAVASTEDAETEDADSEPDEGDETEELTASVEDTKEDDAGSDEAGAKSSEDDATESDEVTLTNDGEDSKEESKEDTKEESTEDPKEESTEDTKEESKEDAAESIEDDKEASQETTEADDKDSKEADSEEGEAKSGEQEDSKEAEVEADADSDSKEGTAEEEDAPSRTKRGTDDGETEESAEAEKKDESGEDAKSDEEGDSGEDGEESQEAARTPEEDLIEEIEIPENLRPREHINQLLRVDEENEEKEKAIQKAAEVILKDLKKLYDSAIQPLETLYKYRDLSNRHFGDPEIFSKPLVLFMGPWSGGKSSIINYLLDIEYTPNALRTGAEPSPAYFNILMHGDETEILDGTQLAADWTFSGLQKFGQGMLDRLRGLRIKNKLLEKVNIVEIPGILEIRKQVQRLFPFNDACQWFIDRADIIFLVYDPSKLDVGPETEAILDQLKGREYQTRIILNKADQVKPEELMRVQGALIWNISPLMSSAEPPIMYSTSLWSLPYEAGAPTRLLYAQERAFLRDLRSAIDKRVEHKIASARRFAVRVRNHAKMVDCYLTTYYNHKTFFANKKEISDKIIENPQDYHIYEGLSTLTNISRYDLPDPDVYRDFFRLNSLYDFQQLSSTCTYFRGCPINRLDVAIAYDLPELVGKYKKSVEAAMHEGETTGPAS